MGLQEATEYMENWEKVEDLIHAQSEYILKLESRLDGVEKEMSILKSARSADSGRITEILEDLSYLFRTFEDSRREISERFDSSRHRKYVSLAETLMIELADSENRLYVADFRKKTGISKQECSRVIKAARRQNAGLTLERDKVNKRRWVLVNKC
jgi:hypothetical protein